MKKNMNGGRKILQRIRSFFPQKLQMKLEYRIKCGRKLNLKNPKRYTEKLQVYKYKYRNPKLPLLAAKDTVRDYIKKKGLESILNTQYGVYSNVEDIDFNSLPDKFVIKLNTGSGLNILVEDKNKLDIRETKKELRRWLKTKPWVFGTEWAYKNIKPRIIIEKYLDRDSNNDLPDYKFFCFDGEVEYLYVMKEYIDNHKSGKLSFFDKNFNKTKYHRSDYKPINQEIPKPKNFDEMINIAKSLSKGIPHVRVDLYNIDGRIVFGELTFYTSGGYINFIPDEFDFILGRNFNLDKITEKGKNING